MLVALLPHQKFKKKNETWTITTDPSANKRIIRENYEQLHKCKRDNLDKMDNSFKEQTITICLI